MAKALMFLLALILLVVLGYWLSVNSGELTFLIFGYQIETSVMVGIISVVVFTVVLYLLISLLKKIFSLPYVVKTYFVERKTLNIIDIQGKLIIEMAAKNMPAVKKLAASLGKLTKNKAMREISDVLSGKAAEISTEEAFRVLDLVMLDNKVAEQNWLSAHAILEKAWARNKTKVLLAYIVEVYIKLESWSDLEDFVEANISHMDRAQAAAIRTIARYNMAKETLKEGGVEQAMDELTDLLKLSPKFYYTFLLLIEIAIKYQIKGRILNTAKSYFSSYQSPEVTIAILKLSELFHGDQLYNFALNLHRDNGESIESKIILAQFSLNTGMYDQAFREISHCLSIQGKTTRLCLLMAEFCQRTQGGTRESIDWIKGAMTSTPDTSCGCLYLDLDSLIISNTLSKRAVELVA